MFPMRQMPSKDPSALKNLYLRRRQRGLVVCADTTRAHYPMHPDYEPAWGCLSLVAVRRGLEEYRFHERTLTVDDDVYLLIAGASRYSYTLRSSGGARCLMVSFPEWMVNAAASSVRTSAEHMLDPIADSDVPNAFVEHLAQHDALVTPELRRIERACLRGIEDHEWYLQQMGVLLQRVLDKWSRCEASVERIATSKPSTRRELARRVSLATDRIHEAYRQPLDLNALAEAAALSPFHLLRVFKQLHGITPQEFLQRKRVAAARRLLINERLSTGRVAAMVGFESRSSLHRWVRRVTGRAPGALRRIP